MKRVILSVAFFFLFVNSARSIQDTTDVDTIAKPKIKVFPIVYFTPETRFAAEGFAYLSWISKGTERKSNVRLFAVYTQNKQLIFILPWQVYGKNEKIFLDGRFDLRKFPEYFYGIGNNTAENIRAIYGFSAFTFENKAYLKTANHFFIGLNTQYLQLSPDIKNSLPAALESNAIGLEEGYQTYAFGPSFLFDSRDQILSASRGKYLEVTNQFGFATIDGQKVNYLLNRLDFRLFKEVDKKTIWASQLLLQSSAGEVPFRSLPALGGPYIHRGYYQGRFRDKHLWFMQTEVRRSLSARWGMVGFLSAGRVYSENIEKVFTKIHPAIGTGLRFQFSKKERTNIRLDFSITPDSRGIYLFFAEAF
jgi:outer membrane protein assembly factor BamA